MTVQLRVETLEPRDLPASFGTPWPDGQHLTLSFAPDGTAILGAPSNLTSEPNAQLAVLRAFQMWAVQSNVNIGLVADNGAAFGTAGVVQGDSRFGDIRIGGRELAPDVLAITAPYQPDDDYSGNVVVDTAANFGPDGYDLFTAMMQEAGHALGVGNSTDTSSVMYEYYQIARAGLSAADVASIRALYGARRADTFEGTNGNNTLATATTYPALAGPITADLTTSADLDLYRFTAGSLANSVTVELRAAGLSLLTARVELLDARGRVVASGAVTDPTQNNIALSFDSVRAGQTYFVRVSGARSDEFAIGSYELDVKQSSSRPVAVTTAVNLQSRPLVDSHSGAAPHLASAPELASGTLSHGINANAQFTLAQSGQVRFVLTATGAPGSTEVVITDTTGREVGRFASNLERGQSLDLFLSAGAYKATVHAVSELHIDFRLGMILVTDPIGARPADPKSAPASTAPQPTQPVVQPAQPVSTSSLVLPPQTKPIPPSPLVSSKSTVSRMPALPPPQGANQQSPSSSGPVPTKTTAPAKPLVYVLWY